ncbi:MAG: glycoside hydrolase family 16 [Acidimicrobiaceae bacterium]|nr:glycoside hydrolase family 16 [Acidimicrobiaceae bacterium]
MKLFGASFVLAAIGVTVGLSTSSSPQYSFDDEFNGAAGASPNSGLAHQYWMTDPCWTKGCGTPPIPTRNSPSNAYLDGHGHLAIVANQGATGSCGPLACRFQSGRLTMVNWSGPARGTATWSQQYGTFSARIRVPTGQGIWPAFWMVGSNSVTIPWPTSGEIDIIEGYGEAATVQQHAEFGTPAAIRRFGHGAELPHGQSLGAWHTYTVVWSPDSVRWEVDGRTTLLLTSAQVGSQWKKDFEHPYTLVLDLAVGGFVGDPSSSTVFPAKMLVDWIRVSQSY